MPKVLVTEAHLQDIANAIRQKAGSVAPLRPGEMAAAIADIEAGYPEPSGTLPITANGTVNVKDYASANVNVQPSLQSKTVTENGTVTPDTGYDGLSSVVVNVSGGGGGGEPLPMTVTASSTFSQSPKQPSGIFGDVAGNFWGSNGTNNWLNINFTTPFNLKKVRLSNYYRVSTSTYWYSSNITVRASNDGFATYTDLYTGTGLAQSDTQFEIDLNNSDAYIEYRFIVSDATAYAGIGRVSLEGETAILLQSKTATQNGTVTPDDGYDGLSSVVVNVQGGGSVTRKTQSEWDALTHLEKVALGLTVVGEMTDITGSWYDYSKINYVMDLISAVGDDSVDTKTINVSDYGDYERLAVFVAINDNNSGVIEINGVTQTLTQSGDVYFCAALITSAASFTVTIGHGDGGSAMYSVAVYGINGLSSATNYAAYLNSSNTTISVANTHRAAIVDVMTDRVSGVCVFAGTDMTLTQIGRGFFGDLYHTYLFVYGLEAGVKQLSGPSGVKCFQILALD